jgi:hypothetical protein
MSDNEIGNDPMDDINDDVSQNIAAMKVRHILEKAVIPRITYMLERTRHGEAIHACEHLVGMPGDGDNSPGPPGFFDWMCEGVGMMCRECAFTHTSDESTPHCDPRHATCIVCGCDGDDDDLKALGAKVEMREPVVMASDASDAFSAFIGERIGRGYIGLAAITPIAWECRAHDGFLDSKIKLVWPGGKKSKKIKGKKAKKSKDKGKRKW